MATTYPVTLTNVQIEGDQLYLSIEINDAGTIVPRRVSFPASAALTSAGIQTVITADIQKYKNLKTLQGFIGQVVNV